jgi:hypothetical protein
MKRLGLVFFVVALFLCVGVAAADPGPNNPSLDMVTNVDCEGEAHDYDLLYTVGLAPWFDPDGNIVGLPAHVERQIDEDNWEVLGDIPGRGIPLTHCTWERGDANFRGEVQFAPPK